MMLAVRSPLVMTTGLLCAFLAGRPAAALEQAAHLQITQQICQAEALPEAFCRSLGVESANVDAAEFNDLAAHAQRARPEQPSCEAARAAAARLRRLGGEARVALLEVQETPGAAAVPRLTAALGRALHTLQDACAHAGISNPQHAWSSRSDLCLRTQLSPDVQPAALECARGETLVLLRQLAELAAGSEEVLATAAAGQVLLPTAGPVCDFLAEAAGWDGRDLGWEESLVTPRLRQHLLGALRGEPEEPPVCTDAEELGARQPAAALDVSAGPATCTRLRSYCLLSGRRSMQVPPWQSPLDEPGDELLSGTTGCQLGPASSAATPVLAPIGLLLLLLLLRRRRAASAGTVP